MTRNYYFLANALPELQIGVPPDLDFRSFIVLAKNNLWDVDYEEIRILREYYDIQNIRSFWREEEISDRGNYDENALEEALLTQEGFPPFVYDFLDRYDDVEERLYNFPALVAGYFQYYLPRTSGFLHDYLTFEREWRLVFTGFRAKKLGRDLMKEMQFEDPNDDLVAQIIAQKDAKNYEPPDRYADLKVLFEEHGDAPMELHQALCDYRFQKIDSLLGVDIFTINRIVGYMAQLIIVEKWLELDRKKGEQIVESIVKEAS